MTKSICLATLMVLVTTNLYGEPNTIASDQSINSVLKMLSEWTASPDNPILTVGPKGSWDENIRERMWVIYEDGKYHGWYCGWKGNQGERRHFTQKDPRLIKLGYATSDDGINWTKYAGNPVFSDRWTEDICVVKVGDTYYMYCEDEYTGIPNYPTTKDRTTIHLLTSKDKIHWTAEGTVLSHSNEPWERGWVGTPVIWVEDDKWYMFYEGGPPGDMGIAISDDGRHFKRIQKAPVFARGEAGWEKSVVVFDSMTKIGSTYYAFYHGQGKAGGWQVGIVFSQDLMNWERYEKNPIFSTGVNSSVIVDRGDRYLLYSWPSEGSQTDIELYYSKPRVSLHGNINLYLSEKP